LFNYTLFFKVLNHVADVSFLAEVDQKGYCRWPAFQAWEKWIQAFGVGSAREPFEPGGQPTRELSCGGKPI
jgi:hypothetical protein